MDPRIDMLEREVCAIKADIAAIKSAYWTREDARQFDIRLAHIEADVAALKAEVAQLQVNVAELKTEVARLNTEIVKIRAEMQNFATKADLLDLEARLKTWMVGIMFSTLTITAAIQIGLYTAYTR